MSKAAEGTMVICKVERAAVESDLAQRRRNAVVRLPRDVLPSHHSPEYKCKPRVHLEATELVEED